MPLYNPELIVFFQLLFAEMFFLLRVPKRPQWGWRGLAWALGSAAVLCAYFTLSAGTHRGIVAILGYFLAWGLSGAGAYVCFDISLTSTIFVSAGSYAIQHMGFSLESLVNMLLTGISPSMHGTIGILMPYLWAVVMYFAVIRKNHQVVAQADLRQIFISALLLLLCIVLNFVRDIHPQDMAYIHIYDFITCLSCLLIQFSISNAERVREENRMLAIVINKQHEQHELSRQAVEMLNIKFHDIRSQISRLQTRVDSADQPKFAEVQRTLQIYASVAQTGNATIDAILMEKSLMCEMNDIRLSYIVDGQRLSFMDAVDIFSLLNNILDNAIECELKVQDKEKRIISIRIVQNQEMVLLDAENYCDFPVDLHQENPQTTKSNKEMHGLGMKGIRFVVDKYRGSMQLSQEDGMFRISIVFAAERP